MTQEQEETVQLILRMLKAQLKQNNLYIGVLLDKKQLEKSKIAFLDRNSSKDSEKEVIVVELSELNDLK